MEDIIKLLIDIDKKAQKLDRQALEAKENMEAGIANEAKAIDKKYMDEAEKIIDKEVASIRDEAQKEWEKEEETRKAVMDRLTNEFNDNCDKWVNRIVSDVLN